MTNGALFLAPADDEQRYLAALAAAAGRRREVMRANGDTTRMTELLFIDGGLIDGRDIQTPTHLPLLPAVLDTARE